MRLIVDIKNPNIDFEKFKLSDNSEHRYMDFDLKLISKFVFGINSELMNELKTRNMFLCLGLKPEFEKMYINPGTLELESKIYDFE
ncbi:MAG: hypothetical protein ACJATE_002140 [Bacteroidia bacterium]